MEFLKSEEASKIALSIISGFLINLHEKYSVMLLFMFAAIVFDVITGILKAKCKGEKLSSRTGTKGFFKKMIFFIAYFFGVFLDIFVPYALNIAGTDITIECCFGLIIGAYITLNEIISICENLYECNSDIFPEWLLNLIRNIKDKINKKGK